MQDLSREIEQALDLLEAAYKWPSERQKLILDKSKTVYLQIALFKTPFAAPRKRKFLRLRHSLYGNDPEICLFVPNRKTGVEYKKTTEELIDFCVDHYTGILEKHKVTGITTVMPLKQLKSEYGTYELRRKLVHRFDLFLCKNSLLYNSRFLTSLGKIFRTANKEPLGISFPKEDVDYDPEFQKSIERAIFTSSFYINRFSDNYSVPFGCLSNTKGELKENLQMVLHQILKDNIIPGGFKNVRAMYLWPSQSKPVPLYISPELPIDMKKPSVKSKRRRLRGVEGDLSTQPGRKVFVTPSGEVFVASETDQDLTEAEVYDSEGEDSFKDESDNDSVDDDDDVSGDKGAVKCKDITTVKKGNTESEDDEEIEEKEARLLEIKRRTESDYRPYAGELGDKGLKVNQRKKMKQDVEGDSGECTNEKADVSERKTPGKIREKRGTVKEAKRKILTKQNKSTVNERGEQRKKFHREKM